MKVDAIKYKDKQREKQRQQNKKIKAEQAAAEAAEANGGGGDGDGDGERDDSHAAPKKSTAAIDKRGDGVSAAKAAHMAREEDDEAELAREASLMKKLKRGKISQAEFDKLMGEADDGA